ncbi:MAG: hypothetical protein ABIO74_00025, partial [Dokdonella sp.]
MKTIVLCALALGFLSVGMPLPAAASASDPYAYDSTFNGGTPIDDRFAGSASADYHAQKLVKLANGDVV